MINKTKDMTMKEWKEYVNDFHADFRRLRRTDSHAYYRYCLKLQREVRGIDAVFLTANAAMLATPPQYQIRGQKNFKRGMIAYAANFNDSNKADHIFDIASHNNQGRIITWSNDVRENGAVDQVFLDFYPTKWNAPIQFASWWLNGVYFGPPDIKHEPKAELGPHYKNVIQRLVKIRDRKIAKGGTENLLLAEDITKDIKTMRARYREWQ